MLKITKLFAENYVVFKDANLDLVPGLTVLRGHNKDRKSASNKKSTNAVGKSLLASAVPECLFDAAPLQKTSGRNDVKVSQTGAVLGFEAVVQGKALRVVKRGAGSSFKIDAFVGGSEEAVSHRKAETLAHLQKLIPLDQKLYYTTTHLTSRLPGFGTSTPEERFALFSSFVDTDSLPDIAAAISERLAILSKLKDKAEAASALLTSLPPLRPLKPFSLFGQASRYEKLSKLQSSKGDEAQALYTALPATLKNKFPFDALQKPQALDDLIESIQARIEEKQAEEQTRPQREKLQRELDNVESEIFEFNDLLASSPLCSQGLLDNLATGSNGQYTEDFKTKWLYPLRDKWDKVKDKTLPPLPTDADVAREAHALESLTHANISLKSKSIERDVLAHVLKKYPKQCAFLSKALSNAASFAAQSASDRQACFDVFKTLTSLLTAAERIQEAQALHLGGLAALQMAHKKRDKLDRHLRKVEDFYLQMTHASAAQRKAQKLTEKLDALPAPTGGADAQRLQDALEILKLLKAAFPSKEEADGQAKLDSHFEKARQILYTQRAHLQTQHEHAHARRTVRQDVAAFESVREEFEDLTLLKSTLSAKGLKAALLENVIGQYEKNLNAVSSLLFAEETTFSCKAEGSSFFILARRAKMQPCDVRKFSGSEATAFALLNVLALLPLLPDDSKTNLLILDEMESAPLDDVMQGRFVSHYLPEALRRIECILCITTRSKEDLSFDALDPAEFTLTRVNGQTQLLPRA